MTYTREQLIDICLNAIVWEGNWEDRDTCDAQMGVGACLALLKAGCKFQVKTKENSELQDSQVSDDDIIHIKFWAKNAKWFNILDADTEEYPDGLDSIELQFHLPTQRLLDEKRGKDWY